MKSTEKNENFMVFTPKSAENYENSKKQKKLKKKKDNLNKKVKTMQILENSRFSQVLENVKEDHRIRSKSVNEKSYWGLSPKQLSRFFVKKFLNDL